jgi:hypothetical protein
VVIIPGGQTAKQKSLFPAMKKPETHLTQFLAPVLYSSQLAIGMISVQVVPSADTLYPSSQMEHRVELKQVAQLSTEQRATHLKLPLLRVNPT